MNAYQRMLARKEREEQQKAQAEFQAMVDAKVQKAWEVRNRLFDGLMLYTLFNDFGFDKDKLIEFYRALDEEHKRMCDLLGKEDAQADEHYAVFRKYLKDYAGLDLDELYAELESEGIV